MAEIRIIDPSFAIPGDAAAPVSLREIVSFAREELILSAPSVAPNPPGTIFYVFEAAPEAPFAGNEALGFTGEIARLRVVFAPDGAPARDVYEVTGFETAGVGLDALITADPEDAFGIDAALFGGEDVIVSDDGRVDAAILDLTRQGAALDVIEGEAEREDRVSLSGSADDRLGFGLAGRDDIGRFVLIERGVVDGALTLTALGILEEIDALDVAEGGVGTQDRAITVEGFFARPPQAADDTGFEVAAGGRIDGLAPVLLANDLSFTLDPAGDPLALETIDPAGVRLIETVAQDADQRGTLVFDAETQSLAFVAPVEAFGFLGEGETVRERFSYAISDGPGGSEVLSIADVEVVVTGINDAPAILAESVLTGALTERPDGAPFENGGPDGTQIPNIQAAGAVVFADPDLADIQTVTITQRPGATLGTLSPAGPVIAGAPGQNGGRLDWLFSVADADLDALAGGETRVQSYDVAVDDGQGGVATDRIEITLAGTNDAPEILSESVLAGAVAERDEADPNEGMGLIAEGSVVFADVDLADTQTVTITPAGEGFIGTLEPAGPVVAGAAGEPGGRVDWVFDSLLDPGFLAAGQVITQAYEVTVADSAGATATDRIEITLTGAADTPELLESSVLAATVSELADGADGEGTAILAAEGAIDVFDDDLIDGLTIEIAEAPEAGQVFLGSLTPLGPQEVSAPDQQGGSLAWRFEVADADLDALGAGETVVQRYAVSATDSTGLSIATEIAVTLEGANDAPVVALDASDLAGEVPQTGPDGQPVLSDTGVLAFDDPDLADLHFGAATEIAVTPEGPGFVGALSVDPAEAAPAGGAIAWSFEVTADEIAGIDPAAPRTQTYELSVTDGAGARDSAVLSILVGGIGAAPVAVDDSAELLEIATATGNVLDNDSDPDGDALSVVALSVGGAPAALAAPVATGNGTLTLLADGSFTYTPDTEIEFAGAGFVTDTVTYTISDGALEASADLAITVTEIVQDPQAVDDAATVRQFAPLSAGDLFANDIDLDEAGDPLDPPSITVTEIEALVDGVPTVLGVPDGAPLVVDLVFGQLTLFADGLFDYVASPVIDFFGAPSLTETFTYTISDGIGTDTATVTITVEPGLNPGIVTTVEDIEDPADDAVSLREAVAAVNAGLIDTIAFGDDLAGQVIRLGEGGTLVITNPVTIEGPEGGVVLSGDTAGDDAITAVSGLAVSDLAATPEAARADNVQVLVATAGLTLDSVAITGGRTTAADGFGGGLRADGTVTIATSVIAGNIAEGAAGGGISATELTITGSTITGNTSGIGGGGINAEGLTVIDSVISANTAPNSGAGLSGTDVSIESSTITGNTGNRGAFSTGDLSLTDSVVAGNTADGDQGGGGVFGQGDVTATRSVIRDNTGIEGGLFAGGTATVTDSTVSGNVSPGNSGGVFGAAGVAVANSTIFGNTGTIGAGIGADGPVTVTNTTIVGNTATDDGAGGIQVGSADPITLQNAILLDNGLDTLIEGGGAVSFQGGNVESGVLSWDLSFGGFVFADVTRADVFGTQGLAANGSARMAGAPGAEETILTLAPLGVLTNPVIDAGSDFFAPGDTDQRGLPRSTDIPAVLAFGGDLPAAGPIDLGAVEVQSLAPANLAGPAGLVPGALAAGDVFEGFANDGMLDAGAGADTVVYALSRGEIEERLQPDGTVAVAGPDGAAEMLAGVERILLEDGAYLYGMSAAAPALHRLFAAAFDRAPDQEGLIFWDAAVAAGTAFEAAAEAFVESPEFEAAFGGAAPSAEAYIDALYRTVFGRGADAEGEAFWLERFAEGVGRAEMLAAFAESPENLAATAADTDDGLWVSV